MAICRRRLLRKLTICALSNCSMASGPLIGTVMVCFR